MNTILLAILLIVVCLYNITLKSLPESRSATAYAPERGKLAFTLYSIVTGVLLLITWIPVTPDEWRFLPFLCCTSIFFAGVTTNFLQKFERPIHYTAAVISFGAWLAWMCILVPWQALAGCVALFLICLLIKGTKYYVYFAELIAIIFTAIWLLIN